MNYFKNAIRIPSKKAMNKPTKPSKGIPYTNGGILELMINEEPTIKDAMIME